MYSNSYSSLIEIYLHLVGLAVVHRVDVNYSYLQITKFPFSIHYVINNSILILGV